MAARRCPSCHIPGNLTVCELMAMSFSEETAADFSIREFALRGEDNADGWGLAWYPDRALAIVKEPVKWRGSPYPGFLENYHRVRSRIYLAHVRHKTTGGEPTHADTHPFARELGGRDYCFAHNGTLAGPFWELRLGCFKPVGNTDSEYLFCHLLGELAQRQDPDLDDLASWQWLHQKLTTLNRHGKLNAVLSDGQRVFCYHDLAGWKGLTFRKAYIPDEGSRHLSDPTLTVELGSEAINHGYVVATRPLTSKGWLTFAPGELLVFEEGSVVYSSHRSVQDLSVFMTSLSAS